ncbi:Uncharacterized protein DAT39_018899, partial [Clarias magur]
MTKNEACNRERETSDSEGVSFRLICLVIVGLQRREQRTSNRRQMVLPLTSFSG